MFERWLIFTKNNARWLKLPEGQRPELQTWENAIKNPDVRRLVNKRIPMVYWKLEGGQVLEMTLAEKKMRDNQIRAFGIDNVIDFPRPLKRAWNTKAMMWFVLGWAAASSIAWGWLAFNLGAK